MKRKQFLLTMISIMLSGIMSMSPIVAFANGTDNETSGVIDENATGVFDTSDFNTEGEQEESISSQMSGLDWLQGALENNNFAVDVSGFNLVQMPSNIDNINNQYSNLMQGMVEMGYGERSELEIKNNIGYSMDAMSLFDEQYGDLFPNGLQLEKASIPSGFDFASLAGKASSIRNSAYSKVLNSDAFTSVKKEISTSKLTDFDYIERATLKSHDELGERLGVSDFDVLQEVAGFQDLKQKYTPNKYAKDNGLTYENAYSNAVDGVYYNPRTGSYENKDSDKKIEYGTYYNPNTGRFEYGDGTGIY